MDKNLYLFNALGFGYNDSPRVIFEAMLDNPKFKNAKFVWAVSNPKGTHIPNAVVVKMDTFKYFLTALRAHYWVSCMNIERGLTFKKRKTIYLNTWHGIPIKAIGNNAKGRHDFNFKNVNYFCVSSDFEVELYKQCFALDDRQFLKVGMPRDDELFHTNQAKKDKIKEELGLPKNKKIVLYAPTFRDNPKHNPSYFLDLKELYKTFGNDIIIIFRGHHLGSYENQELLNNFVYDFTDLSSPNPLIEIADLLITDYSSIVFDYCALSKPFIIFAYDLEYYKKERGFSLDVERIFGKNVAYKMEELITLLKKKIVLSFDLDASTIKNDFLSYAGSSTIQCIDKISEDKNI